MYARFRKAYYGINYFEMLLNVLSLSRKDLLRSLIARDKTNQEHTVEVCIEFARRMYPLISSLIASYMNV